MSIAEAGQDGRHDFDFAFDDWTVRNRKLRGISDPECSGWVAFDAISHAVAMMMVRREVMRASTSSLGRRPPVCAGCVVLIRAG